MTITSCRVYMFLSGARKSKRIAMGWKITLDAGGLQQTELRSKSSGKRKWCVLIVSWRFKWFASPIDTKKDRVRRIIGKDYEVHTIRFQTFLVWAFKIVVDSWKFTMLSLYILWDDFYDFSFKWTATAAIAIHPTKTWLSQLVNFKNEIWTWGHFRRTICNKILF